MELSPQAAKNFAQVDNIGQFVVHIMLTYMCDYQNVVTSQNG